MAKFRLLTPEVARALKRELTGREIAAHVQLHGVRQVAKAAGLPESQVRRLVRGLTSPAMKSRPEPKRTPEARKRNAAANRRRASNAAGARDLAAAVKHLPVRHKHAVGECERRVVLALLAAYQTEYAKMIPHKYVLPFNALMQAIERQASMTPAAIARKTKLTEDEVRTALRKLVRFAYVIDRDRGRSFVILATL